MKECSINNARALLELDLPSTQMTELSNLLRESKELRMFLQDPVITARQKAQVMEKIGQKAGWDGRLINFLKRCCVVEIADSISEIMDCYQVLLDQKSGNVNGILYYAGEGDPDELLKKAASDISAHLGGAKVKLKAVKDDTLIGGYLVRAGGVEYDKSYSGQLNRLLNRINNRR
jgi:F-type H+-transporting ATPase subunit delta